MGHPGNSQIEGIMHNTLTFLGALRAPTFYVMCGTPKCIHTPALFARGSFFRKSVKPLTIISSRCAHRVLLSSQGDLYSGTGNFALPPGCASPRGVSVGSISKPGESTFISRTSHEVNHSAHPTTNVTLVVGWVE